MKRVNWAAKFDYEFLPNYKTLQKAFDDCHISKHIEVDRLVRAKFQDNLEFLQWLKSFYESNTQNQSSDYDPLSRRFGTSMPSWACQSKQKAQTSKSPSKAPVVRKQQNVVSSELDVARRERDFYLDKLRAIEILTESETYQKAKVDNPALDKLIVELQQILFSED